MAVIGKIRSRSTLLFGAIGVAMVLFILGDFLNSGGSFLAGRNSVGEIWGEEIDYAEFEGRVQERIGTDTPNEDQRQQIRDQVWNTLMQEKILYREYNNLGLATATEEILYQIKANPRNEVLIQYFTNPQTNQIFEQFRDPVTGGLNSEQALLYLKNLANSGNDENWDPVERALRNNRVANKFNNLIKHGLYVSSKDAEINFREENQTARFNYVMKEYGTIPNEEIEYDESDLQAYYNDHKDESEYTQEETNRSISFVSFAVVPTEEDIQAVEDELSGLIEAFSTTDNDTTFINDYGTTPFNFESVASEQLPVEVDSLVFGAEMGEIFGPYNVGPVMRISKKMGSFMTSDSVRARHILLRINGDTAVFQARIDSIKNVIQSRNNFSEMAEEFSEDFGSAKNGGDLEWFTRGKMVPPFEQACFDGNVGDMPVVISEFGIHLIEITDKSKEKERIMLGSIDRLVEPSDMTFETIYNRASEFSIVNGDIESLTAMADSIEDITVENLEFIKEDDRTLGNFESPRTVIRWIYGAEQGQVSEPFEERGRFVVIALKDIKEEGTLELDQVRDIVEQKFINEKKAERIIDGMSAYGSLEEAGTQLETGVQTVEALSFSEFSIPQIGRENKVFGKIFSMQTGQISEPIAGERGVFVIELVEIADPQQGIDYETQKSQLLTNTRNRVDFEAYPALQKAVNVVDNRGRFY